MRGITLDAGALIALDRDDRRTLAILSKAQLLKAEIHIPATALAQAVRRPARQVRLAHLIHHPSTRIAPLDSEDAISVGVMLARTGTFDIADAHVAICGMRSKHAILTSDPEDLARLAPELELMVV